MSWKINNDADLTARDIKNIEKAEKYLKKREERLAFKLNGQKYSIEANDIILTNHGKDKYKRFVAEILKRCESENGLDESLKNLFALNGEKFEDHKEYKESIVFERMLSNVINGIYFEDTGQEIMQKIEERLPSI